MRLPLALTLLLASATGGFAAPLTPQPAASRFVVEGEAALAAGQPARARDAFETALAADPASVRAYTGLGRAARAQGRPGEAIRYYSSALDLEPNNVDVLAGHAEALAERGATARAGIDLARIEKLCGARPCEAAQRARAAIARATAAPSHPAEAAPATKAAAPPAR